MGHRSREKENAAERRRRLEKELEQAAGDSIPPELQAYFRKESAHTSAIYGSLFHEGNMESRSFNIMTGLVEPETGKYEEAGVSAVVRALVQTHAEKEDLREKIKKIRWFLQHMKGELPETFLF